MSRGSDMVCVFEMFVRDERQTEILLHAQLMQRRQDNSSRWWSHDVRRMLFPERD